MPRRPRLVIPHIPHHVTQRGNRRQICFFLPTDYQIYIRLMRKSCDEFGVEIWAYCLMPNHVHLIAVPKTSESLMLAIGRAHERYTRMINVREGWQGHLWQGRFFSCPMGPQYLLTAAKYIEMNPVRAAICQRPSDYQWSSARAHCQKMNDELVLVDPLISMVGDWRTFLDESLDCAEAARIRLHSRTGKALGFT